jgi:hypothetical protein
MDDKDFRLAKFLASWNGLRRLGWEDYQRHIVDVLVAEIERLRPELAAAKTETQERRDNADHL